MGSPNELRAVLLALTSIVALPACGGNLIQRNEPFMLRRGYNTEQYHRHNATYRVGAAFHIAHAEEHDVLQLTPISDAQNVDAEFDREMTALMADRPKIGPHMSEYGPHTGLFAWPAYLAMDWTHVHHEQTYDILSDAGISWAEKKERTERAVEAYLARSDAARSPAPLEITMRRAGVMMKPYFGVWRTHYPRSTKFFFVAHWWHPAVYEAQMAAGNDREQEQALAALETTLQQVLSDRPVRMLLSREVMPRYTRLSPESANIFDNLHMLHGIVYDILAYEGWSSAQKRDEIARVVAAMSEQPGDRELAKKVQLTDPGLDPREYRASMKGMEGEMTRIMREMFEEMWPMMSPDGSAQIPEPVRAQMRMKMMPGLEPGEHPGSLHEAIMMLVPNMRMDPMEQQAGAAPKMSAMMAKRWAEHARGIPALASIDMSREPALAELELERREEDATALGGER